MRAVEAETRFLEGFQIYTVKKKWAPPPRKKEPIRWLRAGLALAKSCPREQSLPNSARREQSLLRTRPREESRGIR